MVPILTAGIRCIALCGRRRFEAYEPLHQLWLQYMRELLVLDSDLCGDASRHAAKLLKADLHGAYLTVARAKAPSLVGCGGIVLEETANTFQVLANDNRVKCASRGVAAARYGGRDALSLPQARSLS